MVLCGLVKTACWYNTPWTDHLVCWRADLGKMDSSPGPVMLVLPVCVRVYAAYQTDA